MFFRSCTLASFIKLQCQRTDTFGAIWVQTFEIYIQGSFLHKNFMDTSLKST